jgi:hypothetical protein
VLSRPTGTREQPPTSSLMLLLLAYLWRTYLIILIDSNLYINDLYRFVLYCHMTIGAQHDAVRLAPCCPYR